MGVTFNHNEDKAWLGFPKVYFIGSTGGFMGADGLARPFVQIMQGDADRQWFEAIYEDDTMRALGSIERSCRRVQIIPSQFWMPPSHFFPSCSRNARVSRR